MKKNKLIIALLIISAVNLTVMVPGGGIDTRNFSNISTQILSVFNIFLTTLGLVSLFIPYFIYRQQRWSIQLGLICGISYFIVYSVDFAHFFPKSPDPMPPLLSILEAFGILLSIPLIILTTKKLTTQEKMNVKIKIPKKLYFLIVIALIFAIAIVIFATKSAMTIK
ncbi:MAG: hypothetical protein ACWA41_02535 [Putridiphycobacter sp.]